MPLSLPILRALIPGALVLEDGSGKVVLDQFGEIVYFDDFEARKLIGEQMVRPRRRKDGTRYLVLRVTRQEAQKSKVEKFCELLEERISLPVGQPYVTAEHIGGKRVFMHIAHRCSAAAPGRIPVNRAWM